MGKGFEAKLKEAQDKDTNLIVGEFLDTPRIDE